MYTIRILPKVMHVYIGTTVKNILHKTAETNRHAGKNRCLSHGGRARSQTVGQSDPENHTESIHETPKSRKRVRRPQMWKKNKRIGLRNAGKEYTSAPGKKVILPNSIFLFMHIIFCFILCTLGCCPKSRRYLWMFLSLL